MSLSATVVIQAAPNDIPRMASATEATAQEVLVSMEPEGVCASGWELGWRILLQATQNITTHVHVGFCFTCCIALKCASLAAALRNRAGGLPVGPR
jgi:hypothetical protein